MDPPPHHDRPGWGVQAWEGCLRLEGGWSPPPTRSVADAASGDAATGRGRRQGGVSRRPHLLDEGYVPVQFSGLADRPSGSHPHLYTLISLIPTDMYHWW